MLIQQNNQLPPGVPVTSIDEWAASKKQTVAQKANEEFKKFDTYQRGVRAKFICIYAKVLGFQPV